MVMVALFVKVKTTITYENVKTLSYKKICKSRNNKLKNTSDREQP